MAASDEWFSPVRTMVGPDGALWVADWYNFILQHNPQLSVEQADFEAGVGEGNTHINPQRDKERGRIYRAKYTVSQAQPAPKLDPTNNERLVKALAHVHKCQR